MRVGLSLLVVAASVGLLVVLLTRDSDEAASEVAPEPSTTLAIDPSTVADPSDTPGVSTTQTGPTSTPGSELVPNAVVVRVVDGDTIDVDIDGRRESVRLIGIDTPEKSGGIREPECFGNEATIRMEELLVPGDPVYLERDEELYDRFDRVLAYVHRTSDALFVNHQLVLEGFAEAFRFEPNTFHAELFAAAESDARAAARGLWAACGSADVPLGG